MRGLPAQERGLALAPLAALATPEKAAEVTASGTHV